MVVDETVFVAVRAAVVAHQGFATVKVGQWLKCGLDVCEAEPLHEKLELAVVN